MGNSFTTLLLSEFTILEDPRGRAGRRSSAVYLRDSHITNLILAATVDLAKSAQIRATEHHKFEP